MLDTVGDGSGTKECIGDYSAAGLGQTDFIIKPAAGEIFNIQRMMVSYSDAGNFSASGYGAGSALTNGIKVFVANDSGIKYWLTDEDHPIKTNAEWTVVCYDYSYLSFGVGDNWGGARWTFAKAGKRLTLTGDSGDKLVVRLEDDHSVLTQSHFLVQGFRYS